MSIKFFLRDMALCCSDRRCGGGELFVIEGVKTFSTGVYRERERGSPWAYWRPNLFAAPGFQSAAGQRLL
ncbi:unnamed protein product [Nezara viridula]|uniref:Uncharacterized protein n=1 Tax=Nezara viridula TaxID=85310 RepID=A0A9P0H8Q0_NEZVI|nr:unnamed protein product [Nezara viridula]